MNRERAIVAAVLLAASGGAYGFVRETTVTGDPAAGKCLWWRSRAVTYSVNATSAANPPLRDACPACAPCQDASAATALIVNTLPNWGLATRAGEAQACTDFGLINGPISTSTRVENDGVNLVVFRNGYCFNPDNSVVPQGDACRGTVGACATKYNCWEHDGSATIGLTTTTYDPSTGEMLDADIEFHGWDGKTAPANGYYLTCASSPPCGNPPFGQTSCTAVDVGTVALHEAGHVVGLDHTCVYPAPNYSCTADSVMQPIIPTSTTTRRTLGADDVTGICTIYPRSAATLTCTSGGGGGTTKSGGCSTAEGAGMISLLAGAFALLRMRRRSDH
jgi:uncharacterized protein (TIGR03382 family)